MQTKIARRSPQQVARVAFVRQDRSAARGGATLQWLSLLLLGVFGTGCTTGTGYRLFENFDNEPLAVMPVPPSLVYPSPTPPNDSMQWNQIAWSPTKLLQPRVVPREGGGRWAQVQALDGYFALQQQYQGIRGWRAVLARSERLKNPDAQVRGHALLRLVGPGIVDVRLVVEGSRDGGYAGGILLMSGGTDEIRTTTTAELSDPAQSFSPPPGTPLMRYAPGQAVEFFWSIDQATRQLNVTVTGPTGPESTQLTYELSPGYDESDKWRRFRMDFEVYDFTPDTRLFLDDLTIEELK